MNDLRTTPQINERREGEASVSDQSSYFITSSFKGEQKKPSCKHVSFTQREKKCACDHGRRRSGEARITTSTSALLCCLLAQYYNFASVARVRQSDVCVCVCVESQI